MTADSKKEHQQKSVGQTKLNILLVVIRGNTTLTGFWWCLGRGKSKADVYKVWEFDLRYLFQSRNLIRIGQNSWYRFLNVWIGGYSKARVLK